MSRATQSLESNGHRHQQTPEEAQAQQMAVDGYTLIRAKEILCDLWKQGRITSEARFTGENVLSAALHAVENPTVKGLSIVQGARLSSQQWYAEQRRKHEPF